MYTEYRVILNGLQNFEGSTLSTSSFVCRSTSLTDDRGVVRFSINRIVSDQSYYWTDLWQTGERVSRAALESGDYRSFADPADAIAWLQQDDDEDE